MKRFYFLCLLLKFIFSFAQTGNVGINTTNPTNTLHVHSTSDPIRLDGLQTGAATNNLLTVDANGVVKQNASVVGLLVGSYFSMGTSSVNIAAGTTSAIPGVSIAFTPSTNVNALITVSACPTPLTAGASVQGTINLMQNGTQISSMYYSAWDGQSLNRLGNYTTTTQLVSLNAGTAYTFTLQAKSWAGTTTFNKDPFAAAYVGALSTDANSMKVLMSIVLFTR